MPHEVVDRTSIITSKELERNAHIAQLQKSSESLDFSSKVGGWRSPTTEEEQEEFRQALKLKAHTTQAATSGVHEAPYKTYNRKTVAQIANLGLQIAALKEESRKTESRFSKYSHRRTKP